MTTATVPATAAGPRSTVTRRLLALGRAEGVLLLRNRTALFTALLLPLLLIGGLKSVLDQQAETTPASTSTRCWSTAPSGWCWPSSSTTT